MQSFGVLHRRPDLIRLSKDIPQLVACGLVGDVILGKEVSKAAYTPQNTTPWARDREIKDFFHPLILDTMESIKAVFFKPDPAAQMRKCNQLIRANTRKLDRDMLQLKQLDQKTRQYILQASKRGQRNPSQAKQAALETRTFAKELIRIRKQSNRLATSKAQLQSVQMQVNEAFSVRKIEGSIKASTGIMKDVNSLVRLPELTGTMRELSQELMKAGIIEEMVGDSLPDDELLEGEDEEADAEVDKVLGEILQGKLGPAKADQKPVEEEPVAEEEDLEEQEATLEQMRGRLEALKS
ncbi:Vacuolar protein-sorting-associated protein 24 [Imshaugia aleurites]|uniref:Vacuolar protein-sorting-associated protein 24 n=1 Tax=Imshaugia aleurites TaxID=172621 RepID=A0A8H3FRM8_9LECA|nr:Vacuolar protein-sorting-associated protein 24 [Imshaugia aleurites]